MKIAYMSDIHLEMNGVDIKNTEEADVLILAGDIFVEADLNEHNKTLEYFNKEITSGKVVVVTHHAPSSLSIADEYKGDELMNGGYYSDLTKFIEDRPSIKVFIHGHTHTKFDYTIGNTRILCNPRGYKGEKSFSEFKLDYVTI